MIANFFVIQFFTPYSYAVFLKRLDISRKQMLKSKNGSLALRFSIIAFSFFPQRLHFSLLVQYHPSHNNSFCLGSLDTFRSKETQSLTQGEAGNAVTHHSTRTPFRTFTIFPAPSRTLKSWQEQTLLWITL